MEPEPPCELCELGHLTSKCPLMPQSCGQQGHTAAACTEPTREHSAERIVCRRSAQRGHKAGSCMESVRTRDRCFNCEQPGHLSAICPYKSLSRADAVAAARASAEADGVMSAGKAAEPGSAAPSVNDQLTTLYKVSCLLEIPHSRLDL